MQTVAHYNLLERLGTGALGDVYRARDLKFGRTVALMMPAPELISGAERREKFLEQARAAQTLNHPNIATLFDVVEQDGHCYLAYEFAAGPSLRDEMAGRSVNMRRAIELAAQISDALAEGHSRGLVHGDLRPDNIVITPKGSPKILNFGLTGLDEERAGAGRGRVGRRPRRGPARRGRLSVARAGARRHHRRAERRLFVRRAPSRDADRSESVCRRGSGGDGDERHQAHPAAAVGR